jgi:hypothetical protein
MPIPEAGQQIAPWRSGSGNPEYRFDKQSTIGSGYSAIAGFAKRVISNPFPLVAP